MPSITVEAKNTMLGALSINALSLHSAYSTTGDNELTGGSPVYARQTITLTAPAAGRIRLSLPATFNVPPASDVAWLGFWSGSTFMGMAPNGSTVSPTPFIASSATDLTCLNHGFVIGSTLVVWNGSTATVPASLTEGTVYYVVDSTTNTLQLATAALGTPIDVSAGGAGYIQGILVVSFSLQGTFTVTTLTIDLTLVA